MRKEISKIKKKVSSKSDDESEEDSESEKSESDCDPSLGSDGEDSLSGDEDEIDLDD